MAGRQGWNLRGNEPDRFNAKGDEHYAWKGSEASDKSKRCRARRLFDLGPCEECGAPGYDRHHVDGDTGNNTRENVRSLCRRCHMLTDGRLATSAARIGEMSTSQPPKQCVNCYALSKPRRNGRCTNCAAYFARKGVERPSVYWETAAPIRERAPDKVRRRDRFSYSSAELAGRRCHRARLSMTARQWAAYFAEKFGPAAARVSV